MDHPQQAHASIHERPRGQTSPSVTPSRTAGSPQLYARSHVPLPAAPPAYPSTHVPSQQRMHYPSRPHATPSMTNTPVTGEYYMPPRAWTSMTSATPHFAPHPPSRATASSWTPPSSSHTPSSFHSHGRAMSAQVSPPASLPVTPVPRHPGPMYTADGLQHFHPTPSTPVYHQSMRNSTPGPSSAGLEGYSTSSRDGTHRGQQEFHRF
ncbi:hypothetical protein OH77DRAFT_762037 [Trametes cingulata]|nr:hypothetical protein OH77DRAFT_762037 [Trametes cingulata]